MNISPDQITIAVTVYSRRQYLKQAISSALNQTRPVRVFVVEDCGPDPEMEAFVRKEFGSGVQYFRNPKRRGLFGNWNACIDLCQTEWITILHDDDFLAPEFVEAMIELGTESPGCTLYSGRTLLVNERGETIPDPGSRPISGRWAKIELMDVLHGPSWFAGHLFRVADAKDVGGFRETSFMCGDWEMWAKLIAFGGAAKSSRVVAFNRNHDGWDRGSNQAFRSGRHLPTTTVQHKRILAMMRKGGALKFDRRAWQQRAPMSTLFLFRYGQTLAPRVLVYHVRLLVLSKAPHWRYAVFQQVTRLLGPGFIKRASALWNRLQSRRNNNS